MRATLKRLLFGLGLARALHRVRNRNVLTVAMFHRVLPPGDPRFAGANPTYTLGLGDFEQVLDLFARFYSVVGLDAVEAAAAGAPLPRCPLLITFDDGWSDNVDYALPALTARGMPAVLFVATGFIGDPRGFWQERVFDAVATRDGIEAAEARVAALASADTHARSAALDVLEERPLPRCMADADELATLAAGGVSIGGHGHCHIPLTEVADAASEFRACREALAAHNLGGAHPAFSFPHGRCNEALIAGAQEAGFGLCFTSAPRLTPPATLQAPGGIGRISIEVPHRGPRAGLDIAALAFSLITRPHTPT
ncbi:polysaccharide deacetylase family protein [Elioraea rosea]|uniref:polysaccharide deacetylase family protein n=1 Tax=Elioraea rosea TaxID=2492390 RepID=UPI0011849684|nr:polysaccharide deacetylase family protein [Elioraea rosea]